MSYQEQAHQEVVEIISEMMDKGLPPTASISLADVRKIMTLCWERGYCACLEKRDQL